jgi:hypothetical protein
MKHAKSLIVAALLAACLPALAGEAKVPAGAVGKWYEGSVSPTTYWDKQTGVFAGSARQNGSMFYVNADGTYEKYVYIFVKTGAVESEVWTTYKGNIAFTDKTMTLTPTSGHYRSRMGTKLTDRPMTDEDLARGTKTYNWQLEDRDGKRHLVLPFDDGSRFDYRLEEDAKK